MQRWIWTALLALALLGAACTTPQATSNNANPTNPVTTDDGDDDPDADPNDDPELDPRLRFTEEQREAAFEAAQLQDTAEPGMMHLADGSVLVFLPVGGGETPFSAKLMWVKDGKLTATQDLTANFTPPANYDYATGAIGLWDLDGKPYVELIAVFESGADLITIQEAAALHAWPQDPTPGQLPAPAWSGEAGSHGNTFDRCFAGLETDYRIANGMLEVVLTGYAEWTDQEEDQGRDPNDDFAKEVARMKQECVKPADKTQQFPLK